MSIVVGAVATFILINLSLYPVKYKVAWRAWTSEASGHRDWLIKFWGLYHAFNGDAEIRACFITD